MVTALCNIYLNSEIKFMLFKETFPLVYSISDNWLVYIRGKYREQASDFIKNNFPNYHSNCILFSNLYDNDWAKSTREMMQRTKYDYIYIYIEDHFLLKSIDHFSDVIADMISNEIDTFSYSFFNVGMHINSVELLYPDYNEHFVTFKIEKNNIDFLEKEYEGLFPFSLVSVSKKEFFLKILNIERKKLIMIPGKIQARLSIGRRRFLKINKIVGKFGIRTVSFTPACPFNLEKVIYECDASILPIKVGVLKEEVFANYDADLGYRNFCLIKRGLYPKVFKADDQSVAIMDDQLKKYTLSKYEIVHRQYYRDIYIQKDIPIKYVKVLKGKLRIASEKEEYILEKEQTIVVYANIPHTIEGLDDSEYCVKISFTYAFEKGDYYNRV